MVKCKALTGSAVKGLSLRLLPLLVNEEEDKWYLDTVVIFHWQINSCSLLLVAWP